MDPDPDMSDWQSLFPTRAAAEAYVARIADPVRQAAARADLRLDDRKAVQISAENVNQNAAWQKPMQSQDAPKDSENTVQSGVDLTFPYPPTLNTIWRATIVGCRCTPRAQIRMLLSARGRQYRRATIQAHAAQGAPVMPAGARLALTIHVHGRDRRIFDLSNIPKAVEDALTHAGLWEDDSLIDELHLYRHPPVPGGQIRLTVTPLPHA